MVTSPVANLSLRQNNFSTSEFCPKLASLGTKRRRIGRKKRSKRKKREEERKNFSSFHALLFLIVF